MPPVTYLRTLPTRRPHWLVSWCRSAISHLCRIALVIWGWGTLYCSPLAPAWLRLVLPVLFVITAAGLLWGLSTKRRRWVAFIFVLAFVATLWFLLRPVLAPHFSEFMRQYLPGLAA